MTDLAREWFIWAFDRAMEEAVQQHGDAARLAAYEGRRAYEQLLPQGLTGVVREIPTSIIATGGASNGT